MKQLKVQWEKPTLEILEVSHTYGGKGTTQVDTVTTHDFDIWDPPVS